MGKYKYERQDKRIGQSECEIMILGMPSLKLQALIAVLYISGARISEILELNYQNIRINKKDKTVEILMKSLKRRNKKKTGSKLSRLLTFNLKTKFIKYFLEYYNMQPDNKEEKLFDVSRVTVWRYIKSANEFCSPHAFRHSRLQELADKGATAHQIRMFAGHSKLDSSISYIESSKFALEPLKELIS